MKRTIFCAIALVALLGTLHFATARERGLTYHEVQIVDETGSPVTDITSINIYAPDSTTNATIYMDPGLQNAITQSITTGSTNTTFTQTKGTLYWWGPDGYDFTFTDGNNIATNAGHRTRTSSEGRLYFPSYLTNITSADYEDGESVSYGSDDDFIVNAGTTANRLTFTPVTNGTSSIFLGTTGSCCDVNFFGDTADYDVRWDATDNRLEFLDNAILSIGTGNDWYITHNGTTTTMTGALTHASAEIFGADVTFNGTYDVEWDLTRNAMHFLDNAKLELGGDTTGAADTYFAHDGTSLTLYSVAASEPWLIGGATHGFDITYAFETTGTIATSYTGDTMTFSDGMSLVFGSNADASIMYDETTDNNLEILAASVGMSITTNDFLMTLDGAAADQFKIDATGTVAGNAIHFLTTDAGILFHANGAAKGDIGLDAADDLTLTAAGDLILAVTGVIKGVVDLDTTYVEFREEPICTAKLGAGAATGTEGNVNLMMVGHPAVTFEYAIIGTATVLGPCLGVYGLDIGLDDAANDGIQVTEGITARSRSAFTMGTDAFYLEVVIYVTDADGSDVMMIGFRSDEGYDPDAEAYTDMAAVGLNGVDWYVWTIDDDGATGKTDVTPTGADCGDTEAHTVRIEVATDLSCTFYIDGTEPASSPAHDIDTGDVVIPFLYLIHDTEVSDGFQITSWECGLQ